MIAVALVSAFIALRLAIHGREAVVPPLTGLTLADAGGAVAHQGLHLTIENRFYSSAVPEGHVIAQDPPPGFHVRRDWPVRITESLGNQRVPIPNLIGQSERAAMITIRQLGLEPGSVVHMAAPGDPDVVLSQTPAPDGGEMTTPRISLLISDGDGAEPAGYVMPSLVGLSYATAAARATSAGLHVSASSDAPPSEPASPTPTAPFAGEAPATPPPAAAPPPSGTVVAQSPPPGHRVVEGDSVRLVVASAAASN